MKYRTTLPRMITQWTTVCKADSQQHNHVLTSPWIKQWRYCKKLLLFYFSWTCLIVQIIGILVVNSCWLEQKVLILKSYKHRLSPLLDCMGNALVPEICMNVAGNPHKPTRLLTLQRASLGCYIHANCIWWIYDSDWRTEGLREIKLTNDENFGSLGVYYEYI